nr:MAG TPA: hypothetical protein [Caudoviricetes sp.]
MKHSRKNRVNRCKKSLGTEMLLSEKSGVFSRF